MNRIDFIKREIEDRTCVRGDVSEDSATIQYYNDIKEAMQIPDFPIVMINTIEKRIYMMHESNNQSYLVFDTYFLENMYLLNRLLNGLGKDSLLESFMNKMLSEECYTNKKIHGAIKYAGEYMNTLPEVIKSIESERLSNTVSDYLFVQQAFMIAHEIFHYYMYKDSDIRDRGLNSKASFLKSIYDYCGMHFPENRDTMNPFENDSNLVLECLCDSTALIHAIDVGTTIRRFDVAESAVAATVALMNQYIISMIQDYVKKSGYLSLEALHNPFLLRLLHIKAAASKYIREYFNASDEERYCSVIEEKTQQWNELIYKPVWRYLLDEYESIQEGDTLQSINSDLKKQIKKTLWMVYCS